MINRIRPVSGLAIAVLSLYIFCFQFNYPFPVKYILYVSMILFTSCLFFTKVIKLDTRQVLFILVVGVSAIGIAYSPLSGEAIRYTLIQTAALVVFLEAINEKKIQEPLLKIFLILSFLSMLGVFIQFLIPNQFLQFMNVLLRADCYQNMLHSYVTDHAFAGWTAYTGYVAFYASTIIGAMYLKLQSKTLVKLFPKIICIITIVLSMFCVFLTSKRGIIVALAVAFVVTTIAWMKFNNKLSIRLIILIIALASLFVLFSNYNMFVKNVFDRFFSNENFMTGRSEIYSSLWEIIQNSNIFWGEGTASTYTLFSAGAHNIYLQILYENGIIGLVIYLSFFVSCLVSAFKRKCLLSIYVQVVFLVYGLVGNPLYGSNLLVYYVSFVALESDSILFSHRLENNYEKN